MLPIKHQHRDKIFDSGRFPLLLLKAPQKLLQTRRPGRTPLANHQGGIKRTGFAVDQFKVVLGIELSFIVSKEPFVRGNLFALIENLQFVHGQPGPDG